MNLRKTIIGDLYLAASLLFIFLSFVYFVYLKNGWAFLVIGFALALFGIKTKSVLKDKEEAVSKAKPVKANGKSKKKASAA